MKPKRRQHYPNISKLYDYVTAKNKPPIHPTHPKLTQGVDKIAFQPKVFTPYIHVGCTINCQHLDRAYYF